MIVKHSATVPCTCKQIYDLINDIESYPKFLRRCSDAYIDQSHSDGYTATLVFQIGAIKKEVVTRNTVTPHSEIKLELVSGPFKTFNGKWMLTPVGSNACRVDLNVNYDFSSKLLAKTLGPFFNTLQKTMIDGFCKEAERKFSISSNIEKNLSFENSSNFR